MLFVMDRRIQFAFVCEVHRQCKFTLLAAEDLRASLMQEPWPDHDRIWMSIQAILIAVGNVSKVLWPSRAQGRDRGQELCALFEVDDNSPLSSRLFRNHFEHFDERLESWASEEHPMLCDANIGPAGMFGKIDPRSYLRHFDPDTFTLMFG